MPTDVQLDWTTVQAVIDTNVMLDIYSAADWHQEYERGALGDIDGPRALYRRARARDSLLLAMYFTGNAPSPT